MKSLLKLFNCEFETYLDPNQDIIPYIYPTKLLKQLDPNNSRNSLRYFLKIMQSQGKKQYSRKNIVSINKLPINRYPNERQSQINNPKNATSNLSLQKNISKKNSLNRMISWQQMMQRMTLLGFLLIHSNNMYGVIQNLLPLQLNYSENDKWIFTTFLIPAEDFLLKCCSSEQMFTEIKKINQHDQSSHTYKQLKKKKHYDFESIFYIINLLKKLYHCVKKCALLGRYEGVTPITKNFILTFSYLSIKLYDSLKKIIQQMVNNPSLYLPTRKEQKLIKFILKDEIPSINQQIKTVVLNKYFLPYKKGCKTRLFRNEDQCEQTAKVINGIMNSHRDTARQNKMKKYEETLMEYSALNEKLTNSRSRSKINNTMTSETFSPHIQQYSINGSVNGTLTYILSSRNLIKRNIDLDNLDVNNLQHSHSQMGFVQNELTKTYKSTNSGSRNLCKQTLSEFETKEQQNQKDQINEFSMNNSVVNKQ